MASTKIFDFEIKFDTAKLNKSLDAKFGIGSPLQTQWDNIVLNGTRQYVPRREGILADSAIRSTVLGNGEIIYRTPYAKFLYYGKVMIDKETGSAWAKRGNTKIVTPKPLMYTTTYHVKAGAFWGQRASNDLKTVWAAELQKFIDRS